MLGKGVTDGVRQPLVVVGKARSLATLRVVMAPMAERLRIKDIDAGVIRLDISAEFRNLTQAISRFIYESESRRTPRFAGIVYLSRYADDITNCALFERGAEVPVSHLERSEIEVDDEDFVLACELLGIRVS
jgi:hypothetical protein